MAQQEAEAKPDEQRTTDVLSVLTLIGGNQNARVNGEDRIWEHERTYPNELVDHDNAKFAVFEPQWIDPHNPEYTRRKDRRLQISFIAPVQPGEVPKRPTYEITRCNDWTITESGNVESIRPPDARGIAWTGEEIYPESDGDREVVFSGPDGETATLRAADQHIGKARLVERVVTDESRDPDTEIVDYYRKTVVELQYDDCFWMESKLLVPTKSWAAWVTDNASANDNLSGGPMRPVHAEAIAATVADPNDPTWTRAGPKEMPADVDHWRTRESK